MDKFDRIVLGILGGLAVLVVAEALIGDRVGAGVQVVLPADGSTPAVTTPIRIDFSQPMEQASVEKRLTISPPVEGKFHWSGDSVVFTPAKPLNAGQRYQVTLAEGAQSLLGRVLNRSLIWTFSPRALRVVYLSPANDADKGLWTTATDGGKPVQIYHPLHGVDSFTVRPDGSQIAVTVNGEGQAADLWLIDPQGGNAKQLTQCAPDFCGAASWSPDGQRLAYERRRVSQSDEGASAQIWLYDLSSASSTALFQDRSLPGFGPRWSPDGSHLAFFDPQSQAIDVVDLSSGAISYLPSQMGTVGTFSPDGTSMVYEDFRAVGSTVFPELWLGSATGDGKIVELVTKPEEDQFASWSPDGTWIAFGRRRLDRQGGLGSQLMLFNTATSELSQLTDDPNFNNTAFQWSPTGDTMLVQRFDLRATPGASAIWLYTMSGGSFTPVAIDGFGAAWLP